MTLQEIKNAVESGQVVKWSNDSYDVVKDGLDQWFIVCRFNDYAIGLTWRDGVTLNGKEEQFYIK